MPPATLSVVVTAVAVVALAVDGAIVGTDRRASSQSTRWRRTATTTRIGIRMPSCGLMIAATTARIDARSIRPRHSSRSPRSRKTAPNESTWPQIALSNQVTGLIRTTMAAKRAPRRGPPSSRTIEWTSQASATSDRIAGNLIRSPIPPSAFPTMPSSHRTYRYPGV